MANNEASLIYRVGFTADTSGLKKAVNDAVSSLSKLGTSSGSQVTQQLRAASTAALELAHNLDSAFDINTGKLDLTTFQQKLKLSGRDLAGYFNELKGLGPEGEKAFLQVANAISQADLPTRRLSKTMDSLWTSMKNTMKWQLSSSMLHGFISSVSSAYHYTQDLNESLNNIRIVTGKNIDDMDRFAEKANKAARALSTTTTDYTNASLIYFQQGLNDKEVEARTNVTIKLANAAGESAEQASEQLTAIWNNFRKGGEDLEYYADVMTALGASTASSTEEISAGLEKFAAVAETVGLSYNYAAAALATITATTRQSADVVGNALRTLFARIQGLQQGETLDDGTTLNKYSEALARVGVQIKDTQGNLKDMDVILNEIGASWNNLAQDQQMALAQTVSGVRQYTQFIALMNNWDFFKSNLDIANNAQGTLSQQAEIYAESWEAARDRVTAAWENVYDSLINDDFFVKLDDTITPIVNTIATMIDAVGGMQGVLSIVGSLMIRAFGPQMAQSINNIVNLFRSSSKAQAESARALQAEAAELSNQSIFSFSSETDQMKVDMLKQRIELEKEYNLNESKFSQAQREVVEYDREILNLKQKQVEASIEAVEKANQEFEALKQKILLEKQQVNASEKYKDISKIAQEGGLGNNFIREKKTNTSNDVYNEKVLAKVTGELNKQVSAYEKLLEVAESYQAIEHLSWDTSTSEQYQQQLQEIADKYGLTIEQVEGASTALSGYEAKIQALIKILGVLGFSEKDVGAIVTQVLKIGEASELTKDQMEALNVLFERTRGNIRQNEKFMLSWSEQLVGVAGVLTNVSMLVNQVQGLIRAFTDEDMSGWERFVTIISTLGFLIPSITQIWSNLSKVQIIHNKVTKESAATRTADAAATEAQNVSGQQHTSTLRQETSSQEALNRIESSSIALRLKNLGVIGLVIGAITLLVEAYKALSNYANRDAIAAEKAAKAAQELNDAAQETKTQLNDLKSSVEAYDDALEALKGCIEGTEDWGNALENVNEKTDELLEKFPELLNNANLFNADGTLNQDVLQGAIKNAEFVSQTATAASMYGNVQQKESTLKSNVTNATRKYTTGAISYSGTDVVETTVEQDLAKIVNSFDELGKTASKYDDIQRILTEDLGENVTVSKEYADTIYSLAEQSVEASNMMDNANKILIESWAKDNEVELKEGQTRLIAGVQENIYNDALEAIVKASNVNAKQYKIDRSTLDAEVFKGTSFEGKSITEAFNIARGTDYQVATNAVRGTDSNRTYAFIEEDGKVVEHKLEEIKVTIAAAAALQKMGQSVDEASNTLNNLSSRVGAKGAALGIQNYLATGTFESLNNEQFNQLQEDIGTKDISSYLQDRLQMSEEQLIETLGENYANDFQEAINAYGNALKNYTAQFPRLVQEAINNLDNKDGLNLVGQKAIADLFNDAFVYGGEEALNKAKDVVANIDSENIQGFADIIDNIEWDTTKPHDFIKALDEAGIETGLTTRELYDFAYAMKAAVVGTLEAAQEQYSTIRDIYESLNDSDIITPEQYQSLADAGLAVDAYFTQLADGSYALAEDAYKVKDAIQAISMKPMYELRDSYINQYNEIKDYLDKGASTTDQKLNILQLNGDIDQGQAENISQNLNDPDQNRAATTMQAFNTIWDNAVIDSEKINSEMEEAAVQASKIEQSINETEFRNKVEDFELDLEVTSGYAEELSKELNIDIQAARNLAIASERVSRGIKNLNSNLEDYKKVLKEGNKQSAEFYETLTDLKEDLADILNLGDKDFISDEFAQGIIDSEDFEQALQGDAEALARLQELAADNVVEVSIDFLPDEQQQWFLEKWNNFKSLINQENFFEDSTLQKDAANLFEGLIGTAQWSKDQIETILAGLKVGAKVETKYIPQTVEVPTTVTEESVLDDGTAEMYVPGEDGDWVPQTIKLIRKITRTIPGPPTKVDGWVPSYSIVGTKDGDVESSTYFEPTQNIPLNYQIGTVPTGGGGGGSSSSAKHMEPKEPADEKPRYHPIDRQLQNQERELNAVNEAANRAYGVERLRKFSTYINQLNNQVTNYKDKLDEANRYLEKIDVPNLQDAFQGRADIGPDNELQNYEDLFDIMLKDYNDFVNLYNSSSPEVQESLEEEKEAVEETYEKRKKALEQYEDTLDTISDTNEAIKDLKRQIADQRLTAIEYRLELVIDAKSMKDSLLEFQKTLSDTFGDALTHSVESSGYAEQQAQSEANMLAEYQRQYDDLLREYNLASDAVDRSRILDDIKSLQSQVLDSATAIAEWANSIEDLIPEAVEAARARYDEFIKDLEHNDTVLDTVRELYELQGQSYRTEEGFKRLQANAQARMDSQLAQAELERRWMEESEARYREAEAQLATLNGNESDPSYDFLKKQVEAYKAQFQEAQESYYALAKEAMETARDMYLEQIEKAAYDFGQAVSGGVGLDALQEKYDHYIEEEERYLDSVNEAYEVTTWYNKIQQDIDKTDNVQTKNRLKALRDEINVRRQGNTLSQYDLDILNAKYEVLKAQIELEDTRNTKNKLQLVRDRQGNWNYQYTSDPQSVLEAEQKLADAQNNWYNLAKEQVKNVTGEIIDTWRECQEKIRELYNDEELLQDEQKLNERREEIERFYSNKIKALLEEQEIASNDVEEAGENALATYGGILGRITQYSDKATEKIWGNFEEAFKKGDIHLTELLGANNDTLKELFKNTSDEVGLFNNQYAQDLKDMTSNTENFDDILKNTLKDMEDSYNSYQATVAGVAEDTGTDLWELDDLTQNVAQSTDDLRESGLNAAKALHEMADEVANVARQYDILSQSMIDAMKQMEKLATQQSTFVAQEAGVNSQNQVYGVVGDTTGVDFSALIESLIKYEGYSASDPKIQALLDARQSKMLSQGMTREQYERNNSELLEDMKKWSYGQDIADPDTLAWLKKHPDYKKLLAQLLGLDSYDTGGYTGDFNDARLAFLHSKELVLNQDDTSNILSAVQAIRTISPEMLRNIEAILTGNAVAGMALMGQKLGVGAIAASPQTIDQNIHIDRVEFPNITSSSEIEEAFISIANDAVQWARRRTS